MEGLASSMAQQAPVQPQQAGQMPTVEEVIALLMEGTPPEELEKMGIPPELIMEAITILEQQLAAQQQQEQPQQMGGGLAQQMMAQ
tara:strand:+ start:102 stop:359 length:258 start_codon:yes stop_codon:yes gene_type:complete